MNKLESYKAILLEAENEEIYEDVSHLYSDDILEFGKFPDDYSDFLIEILSNPLFFASKGAYHFLAIVGVDAEIMNSTQLKGISRAIQNNFVKYIDEMLCLTAVDFIARYYPKSEAEKLLASIKKIENEKSIKGFAEEGFRILPQY